MEGTDPDVTEALTAVEALYTTNLAAHGVTSTSVGWPDPDSQQLRFDKLAYLLELDQPSEPIAVNDWGCGYGALLHYLVARPGLRLDRYYGYDLSGPMLAAAREATADPRAEFIHGGDITHEAHYSFVSGTFNVRFGASDEAWARYIERVLVQLSAQSTRGFAFNLLSSYVDWRKDGLFYADPHVFFDFCKRNVSRYVSLLHDYALYEWTIVVVKE